VLGTCQPSTEYNAKVFNVEGGAVGQGIRRMGTFLTSIIQSSISTTGTQHECRSTESGYWLTLSMAWNLPWNRNTRTWSASAPARGASSRSVISFISLGRAASGAEIEKTLQGEPWLSPSQAAKTCCPESVISLNVEVLPTWNQTVAALDGRRKDVAIV